MIRTSKEQLRKVVRREYIRMLAETKKLSPKDIQELGRKKPGRVGVGKGMEVLDREIADVEQQLAKAQWASQGEMGEEVPMELDPDDIQQLDPRDDTEVTSRTIQIDPSDRRPYAKKVGLPHDPKKLAEAKLRAMISEIINNGLNQ